MHETRGSPHIHIILSGNQVDVPSHPRPHGPRVAFPASCWTPFVSDCSTVPLYLIVFPGHRLAVPGGLAQHGQRPQVPHAHRATSEHHHSTRMGPGHFQVASARKGQNATFCPTARPTLEAARSHTVPSVPVSSKSNLRQFHDPGKPSGDPAAAS